MLEAYFPIVESAVSSVYAGDNIMYERNDLYQEGIISLIETVQKAKDKGTTNAYLYKTIRGRLLNLINGEIKEPAAGSDLYELDELPSELCGVEDSIIDVETNREVLDFLENFCNTLKTDFEKDLLMDCIVNKSKTFGEVVDKYDLGSYNARIKIRVLKKKLLESFNQTFNNED